MARKRLTARQREKVLFWLSADFDRRTFKELAGIEGFIITDRQYDYYRQKYAPKITEIHKKRRTEAIEKGFAVKEERIQVLKELAEDLFSRDPRPIAVSRELRASLEQIAKEMGQMEEVIRHKGQITTFLEIVARAKSDGQPTI